MFEYFDVLVNRIIGFGSHGHCPLGPKIMKRFKSRDKMDPQTPPDTNVDIFPYPLRSPFLLDESQKT